MELKDITNLTELKDQASKLGSSVELIADHLQGLKALNLDNNDSKLDEAQSMLYKASKLLAEFSEE